MTTAVKSRIPEIVQRHEADLLRDAVELQLAATAAGREIREDDLRDASRKLLKLFGAAMQKGAGTDVRGTHWTEVRDLLTEISRNRALQGFTPSETAMFVFSIKQPLFKRLRQEIGADPAALADEIGTATTLIDGLGLYTTEVYQTGREELIRRQQAEMLELSTPVVQLWDGVLALPLIGSLDSQRTQVVMETLLEKIVSTGAAIAIIDITGVPTVDTLVAQHLLKTVSAARLMGAECMISGIRPQIAQTIVHLGIDLQGVITKATLADAFRLALSKMNLVVNPKTAEEKASPGARSNPPSPQQG